MKAIVDCNSFYCSCERLFKPKLEKRPVVVLSNNDGCIVSRSDEAKAVGVEMAGPYFQARHLIEKHDVAVFSSNYNLYGDLSMRVMDTLRAIAGTDKVEVYSVDEAFVDLPEMPFDQLEQAAREMKEIVEQWTGISVSIGVAPTKTLAKLANHIAKKNKNITGCISILATQHQQREALQHTRLNNIWGIGRANAAKLFNMGITSGWELATMREEWAHANLGGVVGVRLIKELRGELAVDTKKELVEKRMIATTRMFGSPVNNIEDIKEAVATYTSRAAEKLRRQYSAAKVVSVFIVGKGQDHLLDWREDSISDHATLPVATSITQELIKPALELVEHLYQPGNIYKKAGVMLSGLVPDDSVQGNLFDTTDRNTQRQLMSMMDNINFSQRDDILKFASSGTTRDWKMRQELRSGRYTTRWNELFEVK
ncbi:Y-family DNA polymerase [Terrimonas sp. NA20]|uniref:Y-family DNA polymerase n=1 Tax=Terrimonas ginsenosidimutans TaxID=2908004 RepID=A0ABS9KNN1_9BACT|nr:Y-family DNA polymerase [Terrimonas ginsenosidimutans]MCG2613941.1 Y-family DNA polymerase [Terrimonas ginsenosidimutans]